MSISLKIKHLSGTYPTILWWFYSGYYVILYIEMEGSSKITPNLDPQLLNKLLIKEFGYSLFCFALVYANISVNRTSLRKFLIYNLDRQKLKRFDDKLKNLKRKTKKTLQDYYFFKKKLSYVEPVSLKDDSLSNDDSINKIIPHYHLSEFFKEIDKEINENDLLLTSPYFRVKRGLNIFNETKIALIYSLFMQKESEIDIKLNSELDSGFPFKLNIKELDIKYQNFINVNLNTRTDKGNRNWDDTFDLLNWFNRRTSYANLLTDHNKKQVKERIRKSKIKYFAGLALMDVPLYVSQSYFDENNVINPVLVQGKENDFFEVYPVFLIEFKKDFIQIGEIRRDKLVYKKYTKSNSDFEKIPSTESPIIKNEIHCKIVFPNGEQFLFKKLKFQH